MDLIEYIDSLTKERQWEVATELATLALPLWDAYSDMEKEGLTYIDSVVGMKHTVDRHLLKATIEEVRRYVNPATRLFSGDDKLQALSSQFDDPMVALRDSDWELPDAMLKTFYSVHNLLEATMGKTETLFDEATIYVSINQSIDALLVSKLRSVDEVREIIGWRTFENGSRAE